MVTSAGTNPAREIVTARSAAVADPSAVSAKTAASAMKSLRIRCSSCERFLVHTVFPRSNEKHLLIENFYPLLLISLRFAVLVEDPLAGNAVNKMPRVDARHERIAR